MNAVHKITTDSDSFMNKKKHQFGKSASMAIDPSSEMAQFNNNSTNQHRNSDALSSYSQSMLWPNNNHLKAEAMTELSLTPGKKRSSQQKRNNFKNSASYNGISLYQPPPGMNATGTNIPRNVLLPYNIFQPAYMTPAQINNQFLSEKNTSGYTANMKRKMMKSK